MFGTVDGGRGLLERVDGGVVPAGEGIVEDGDKDVFCSVEGGVPFGVVFGAEHHIEMIHYDK